jgi:hypothetical protein
LQLQPAARLQYARVALVDFGKSEQRLLAHQKLCLHVKLEKQPVLAAVVSGCRSGLATSKESP